MHRFVAGTCQFDLTLTPLGPWLVRGEAVQEGRSDVLKPLLEPPSRPNSRFMLPGSSLKGVLRATAERILRTVDERSEPVTPLADATFIHNDAARKRLKRHQIADSELHEWVQEQEHAAEWNGRLSPASVYLHLSAASQLFGATPHAGLVRIDDAYAQPIKQPPRRSHVAIDRVTGGVGEGPFLEELVPPSESLATSLTVTNFALWQLGLFALVFQEINRGYVAIGGGTRKGQGQFRIDIPRITFRYAVNAYDVPHGVISAQARLAGNWYRAADVPKSVIDVEADRFIGVQGEDVRSNIVLLDGLKIDPQPQRDWREAGLVIISIQEGAQVTQFFQEAVEKAWVPWVREVQHEQ